MQIYVESIPEEESLRIEGELRPADIGLDLPGYSLSEPVKLTGHAIKAAEDVHVEARLEGVVDSECSRCLKVFRMPINLDLNVAYAPEAERKKDEPGPVEPDVNIAFYKGDTIELMREVRDLLHVHMPIKPVCREDCKGLCPECGVDLNESPCGCDTRVEASPFDKLKELKAKLE